MKFECFFKVTRGRSEVGRVKGVKSTRIERSEIRVKFMYFEEIRIFPYLFFQFPHFFAMVNEVKRLVCCMCGVWGACGVVHVG